MCIFRRLPLRVMLRLRQGQEKEKFMSEAQAFWGPAEVGAGIFTKYQNAE